MDKEELLNLLIRRLIGMIGGLTKSTRYNLNRDPAEEQLKTARELLDLAQKLGDESLINKLKGMVGGLTKSMRHKTGRDQADLQLKTAKELLKMAKELKNKM
ncbi:hypothetical protein [Persephonella sp.]|uniref:hypothetical protein n=1 Tax=Persephonella sp. TaxID=2060922 RepID=UPI0026215DFD|nr:hypothetical protein [Persephonella sp.]